MKRRNDASFSWLTYTTQFMWDGQNVLLDTNGSGATQGHYTDAPGQWGGLAAVRQAGTSQFPGFDPSLNTRLLTVSNGSVSGGFVYTAFGDEKSIGGIVIPYLFGGQVEYRRDGANRLYVRNRYYMADVALWLSRVGPETELVNGHPYLKSEHSYGYTFNNPIMFIAPAGLYPETCRNNNCANYPGGPCAYA